MMTADASSSSSSLTHQRTLGATDAAPFMRCEFEALPVSSDINLVDVYAEMVAMALPDVEWRGWRRENDSLVAIARLHGEVDIMEDDSLADQVLEALQDSEAVQSARLLSTAANCPDTFAICRRLFSTDVAGLDALRLPTLGATAAASLITHGYAIVDGFLPPAVVDGVVTLTEASLAINGADGLGGADAIPWRRPEPRAGRTDVATWVEPTRRPGTDPVFCEHVLPRIDALAADVRALMAGVRGGVEVQLACFKGAVGARQCRHTDGVACADPAGPDRKVTMICYCNPRWEAAHAGRLRLSRADHDGGGTLDVEPRGGRLLCFLAGAMAHEVLPTSADRYAVTAWLT